MGDNVTACVLLLSYQDDDDEPASHGPARMSYGATSEMLREVPTDDVSGSNYNAYFLNISQS